MEEHGKETESPGFLFLLSPDLLRPSLFPPMMGSPCSCHFSPQRPLFPSGPPSLCPEPHPFSPPLYPPLQLKAWPWVRRLPQLYNSTETQAKFPPHFHGCKSKAASWTSTVQKPDQHLAPQLLSTSKSVEQRAGRHSVTAARGCLFPPAKANSSSDPSRGGRAAARGHGTQRQRQERILRVKRTRSTLTLQSHPAAGGNSRKGGGKDQGVGRATPAAWRSKEQWS